MKKFFVSKKFLIVLLCALFLSFNGCSSVETEDITPAGELTEYENKNETPQKGGTLRLALIGSKTLNPILAENGNNLYIYKLVYDGLFRLAANDLPEPLLCDRYTVSQDGLRYEFIIKEGVTFHNGTVLTAEDVNETFSFLLDNSYLYQNRFSSVASYHSIGNVFYITLNAPIINFESLLDFPIMSKADLHMTPADYVPNGTGRYKVESYKKSKELALTVNKDYHKDFSPNINDIMVYLLKDNQTAISMLENLQIDLLPSDSIDLNSYTPKRNLSSAEYIGGEMTFVGINNQKPALLSAQTRTAIAHSINKEYLMNTAVVQYAAMTNLLLPPNSFWYNNLLGDVEYNQESSRRLLEADGWKDTDDNNILDKEVYGEKVELLFNVLVNSENKERVRMADFICQSLNAVGIKAAVLEVPFAEYESRLKNRSYDLFIGSTSISSNYDLSFLLKTDENPFGFSNERIDQTFNALQLQEGISQKQALFYELCDEIMLQSPLISLFYENHAIVFDSRLKGTIVPSRSDIFYSIEHWFIVK